MIAKTREFPQNRSLIGGIFRTIFGFLMTVSTRKEVPMAWKLDGAKFASIEELVEALFPLYSDRMSEEEFRKYAEENAEKS
jgi:hypothetical protein